MGWGDVAIPSHLSLEGSLRGLGDSQWGIRIRGLTVLWEKACNLKRSSGNHFPRRALVFEILSHSWSNKAPVHWTLSKDDLKQLFWLARLDGWGVWTAVGVKMVYFSLIICVSAQDSSQGKMGFILWEMNVSLWVLQESYAKWNNYFRSSSWCFGEFIHPITWCFCGPFGWGRRIYTFPSLWFLSSAIEKTPSHVHTLLNPALSPVSLLQTFQII